MTTEHGVLVAYASRTGITAAIAESVAASLRLAGIGARCCSVRDVHRMGTWSAIVLGSATRRGRWDLEMLDFLRFHPEALARQPLYLFESGEGLDGVRGIERFIRPLHVRSLRSFSSRGTRPRRPGRWPWSRALRVPVDPEPTADWAREIACDLLVRELHEDLDAWERLCEGPGMPGLS